MPGLDTKAYTGFLAARYLFSRWVNLLGTIGVAVAVWALIVVIAVFSGFIGELRRDIANASPPLLLTGLVPDTSFDELAPLLEEDPDVVATAPRLRHYAVYYQLGRSRRAAARTRALETTPLAFDYVAVLGVDAEREARVSPLAEWLSGLPFEEVEVEAKTDPFTVSTERQQLAMMRLGESVSGSGLLRSDPGIVVGFDRLRVDGLLPGQRLALVSARFDTTTDPPALRKIRDTFAVSGAFETRHRVFDETTALLDIWELRAKLGHDCDTDPAAIDIVSDVAIRLRDGADLDAVATRLAAASRDGGFGGTVRTWEQQNAAFLAAVDQERGMMKLILFAIMLVAAFLIYATLHMMVVQKTRDIGVLTALGANPAGIQTIFLGSGLLVAIGGSGLGTLAGCLSAIYLNDVNEWMLDTFGVELFPTVLYNLDAIPYRLEPGWILQVVVGAIVLSLFAAWLPARRAAAMEPVQAMAHT